MTDRTGVNRSEGSPREAEGPARPAAAVPSIGVVVVTYSAADFIADCLASLLESGYPALDVVVVDNASRDGTVARIRQWFRDQDTLSRFSGEGLETWRMVDGKASAFTLIENAANLGFAGGVNSGLSFLMEKRSVDFYWILNPDTVVEAAAPAALAARAQVSDDWALIGTRVLYHARPGYVHTDGGIYRRWMGFAKSANLGRKADDCRPPNDAELDFVSGASMLASKAFLEKAGLMDETWFLYFEEIDWAFRRGDLRLGIASDAVVHHRAGASIGSGSGRRVDSPFSVYFMYRNRIRFAWRWTPWLLLSVYGWSWAMLVRRYWRHPQQMIAGLWGMHGFGPSPAVRRRLPASDWQLALSVARPSIKETASQKGGKL